MNIKNNKFQLVNIKNISNNQNNNNIQKIYVFNY